VAGRLGLFLLAASIVGCDRATKHWAANSLAGTPGRSFLADTIRLEYYENTGAFLSLGAGLPPPIRTLLFTIGTALILLAAVAVAARLHWTGRPLIGLTLVFAGGASNWADRIARGAAVDFMNVGIGSLRTGIFNVADVAIMVGIGVLFATFRGMANAPAR
jgi:signal peptidase II